MKRLWRCVCTDRVSTLIWIWRERWIQRESNDAMKKLNIISVILTSILGEEMIVFELNKIEFLKFLLGPKFICLVRLVVGLQRHLMNNDHNSNAAFPCRLQAFGYLKKKSTHYFVRVNGAKNFPRRLNIVPISTIRLFSNKNGFWKRNKWDLILENDSVLNQYSIY